MQIPCTSTHIHTYICYTQTHTPHIPSTTDAHTQHEHHTQNPTYHARPPQNTHTYFHTVDTHHTPYTHTYTQAHIPLTPHTIHTLTPTHMCAHHTLTHTHTKHIPYIRHWQENEEQKKYEFTTVNYCLLSVQEGKCSNKVIIFIVIEPHPGLQMQMIFLQSLVDNIRNLTKKDVACANPPML